MGALTRFLTSAKTSWIMLVITVVAATALFALAGSEESETAPSVGLPSSAECLLIDEGERFLVERAVFGGEDQQR